MKKFKHKHRNWEAIQIDDLRYQILEVFEDKKPAKITLIPHWIVEDSGDWEQTTLNMPIGTKFTVNDGRKVYTIKRKLDDNNILVTWGKDSVDYRLDDINQYFEEGSWKVYEEEYPLTFNELKWGKFYTTEFEDQGKYTFKHGYSLWRNTNGEIITKNDGMFVPSNGFTSFRLATEEEKIEEKDYEILSFKLVYNNVILSKDDNGLFGVNGGVYSEEDVLSNDPIRMDWDEDLTTGKCEYAIHSIKRLSDGEIFTVGDTIEDVNSPNYDFDTKEKIRSFEIRNNTLITDLVEGSHFLHVKDYIKARAYLFTTEDGVKIYEGDKTWAGEPGLGIENFCYLRFKGNYSDYKYFSTREALEKYMLRKRECIVTLEELLKVIPSTNRDEDIIERLETFFKEK